MEPSDGLINGPAASFSPSISVYEGRIRQRWEG